MTFTSPVPKKLRTSSATWHCFRGRKNICTWMSPPRGLHQLLIKKKKMSRCSNYIWCACGSRQTPGEKEKDSNISKKGTKKKPNTSNWIIFRSFLCNQMRIFRRLTVAGMRTLDSRWPNAVPGIIWQNNGHRREQEQKMTDECIKHEILKPKTA